MKTLEPMPKFLVWAVWQAIRHPLTPIRYVYCPERNLRLPQMKSDAENVIRSWGWNPKIRQQSPIPWWGSVVLIVLGIISLVLESMIQVLTLNEVGRALIYLPLGNLFGMTLRS